MTDNNDSPKIQIDSDWKAQAQAEKKRMSEQAEASKAQASEPDASATASASRPEQVPPASLETLISTIATQALFSLGAIPDPRTNQRMTNLDLARHHVDTLAIVEEKTRGNLSDAEQAMISQTLYELRSRYIAVSNQQRTQY